MFEDSDDLLVGYQKIHCHLIFDVKLVENFGRKVRHVVGGYTTETPASLTCASVVSRDSVCIEFVLTALSGLDKKYATFKMHI